MCQVFCQTFCGHVIIVTCDIVVHVAWTVNMSQVVSFAIRIPWSENVYYGSLYYVAKAHRRRGYGTRLRDQVWTNPPHHISTPRLSSKVYRTVLKMSYSSIL